MQLQRRTTKPEGDSAYLMTARRHVSSLEKSKVHPYQNPVFGRLMHTEVDKLGPSTVFLMSHYRLFVFDIVGILVRAREALRPYPTAFRELAINVAEETGKRAVIPELWDPVARRIGRNPTHHELMLHSFEGFLGPLHTLSPQEMVPTLAFLYGLKTQFGYDLQTPLAQVGGAGVALEATASLELIMLERICQRLSNEGRSRIPYAGSLLETFINMHVGVVEQDHSDGLVKSLDSYIKSERDRKYFRKGFRAVVEVMETWWNALDVAIASRSG